MSRIFFDFIGSLFNYSQRSRFDKPRVAPEVVNSKFDENEKVLELSGDKLTKIEDAWKCIFDKSCPPADFILQKSSGQISFATMMDWFKSEFYAGVVSSFPVSFDDIL